MMEPGAMETEIDPTLIVDGRSIRQRLLSRTLGTHLGERGANKTMTRMRDWKHTIIASERKRLRKLVLDLYVLLENRSHSHVKHCTQTRNSPTDLTTARVGFSTHF